LLTSLLVSLNSQNSFITSSIADGSYHIAIEVRSTVIGSAIEQFVYSLPVLEQPFQACVFPGDILQFLTNGYLLSTPHKVRLNTRERFAMAYFHEPNFETVVRPLGKARGDEYIHYGSHFTNMFMRCYPERITTRRIIEENRLSMLPRTLGAMAKSA
jgi:isopenicillin N synthase-like dioxygenase